eukprot:TRINITY_DN393_c0_g1_i1.p1 TRINITY_DN393_c0_g1~~TRINITY_DN393_c0_g1_i1.p1  ORF type:complete len:131 (-),score=21.75 TRINITY_DN393_c0_g1_i1:53-445(-)
MNKTKAEKTNKTKQDKTKQNKKTRHQSTKTYEGNSEALLSAYAQESTKLQETQNTADELLDMIGVLTGTVKEQNQSLKRIKRKVLDMVNQFELSRTLLRVIERRSHGDQLLIYGGIVFILILMVVLWWYF